MTQSLLLWLRGLGLERYAEAFSAADVDLDVLPELSEADLIVLGLSLGDRKRLIRALARERYAPLAGDVVVPIIVPAGERRQITVLYCDLVGSTELAARLDPEDLRALISIYHTCCATVVTSHGGDVAQFLGDGVMIEFGFPLAHEDDAERAVRCALALIASVSELDVPGAGPLRTRIGIATGTEVVGDLGSASRDRASVVGTTPSLAARFQAAAEPQTVVLGATTRRLVSDAFVLHPLGLHEIKGASEALELWRVDEEVGGLSRFAARRASVRAEFVARDLEIGLLLDRWQVANGGEGQGVLLSADAGIGKSRMVQEFLSRPGIRETPCIRVQCAPHYSASALHPLRDLVSHAARIAPVDTVDERYAKLATLAERFSNPAEAGDALALVLGLSGANELPRIRNLTIEQKKALTFRCALDELGALANERTVLVVVEDLHWIDPTSLELLTQIVDGIARRRVLLVATARPEFTTPWAQHGHITTLTLNRLGRSAVETMIAALCRQSDLPEAMLAAIAERTDGVPLFVEELTMAVLASRGSGMRSDGSVAIPETLRDALAARLDALVDVRDIAQVGAVIGREFTHDLLAAVSERDAASLTAGLEQLIASGLVLRAMTSSGPGFSFKHALVRDAAYGSLLRARRQHVHVATARALVEHFPSTVDAEPEIVAHHLEEGGLHADALTYWQRAGEQALSRSAYLEARTNLERALASIDSLDARRDETELSLCNALGVVYCVLEGGQSIGTRNAYTRARQIALKMPESAAGFAALWGLCHCENTTGNNVPARAYAEQLIELARRLGDTDLMLEAQHASWAVAFAFGDQASLLHHTEIGVTLYDPDIHHAHVTRFGGGHDSGMCGLGHGAVALVLAGRIGEARAWIAQSRALMERLEHPLSRCMGLVRIAVCFDLIGDYEAALACANACLEIAMPRKFKGIIEHATMIAGAAHIELEATDRGVAMLREMLDGRTLSMPSGWAPFYMVRLAHAERGAGDLPAAARLLEQASADARLHGGCFAEAEIEREWAALRAADGSPRDVIERHLATALDGASGAEIVLLALRAALDWNERDNDAARASALARTLRELLERVASDADSVDIRRARARVGGSF